MAKIVAHYSLSKTWPRLLLAACFPLVILPLGSLWVVRHWHDVPPHLYQNGMIIPLWVLAIAVFRNTSIVFKAIACDGASLIWVEDGFLIWRAPEKKCVRCSDINTLTSGFDGEYGQLETIILRMKDGGTIVISTNLLREDSDDVAKRLKQELNLADYSATT